MIERSIFDLTLEELGSILETNELPEGVGLQGIELREDFSKLFRHRMSPKHIAEVLVKEKAKEKNRAIRSGGSYSPRGPVESEEVKRERLRLFEEDLKRKSEKKESLTHIQSQIYKRLQAIEDAQNMLLRLLTKLDEKVDSLLTTERD